MNRGAVDPPENSVFSEPHGTENFSAGRCLTEKKQGIPALLSFAMGFVLRRLGRRFGF